MYGLLVKLSTAPTPSISMLWCLTFFAAFVIVENLRWVGHECTIHLVSLVMSFKL